ncbi:MAG: redox-sensing transcriptional repressor Rex, partial [Candidatus Omnitrophota bacterium]
IIQPFSDLQETVAKKNISIGIIAVPSDKAQEVANELVNSGIECLLNFAPVSLNVPDNVKVKDVDLSRELETLSYFLAEKK